MDNTWIYGKNRQYESRLNDWVEGAIPVISGITVNNGTNYYTTDVLCPEELFEDSLTISTRGEYSGTVTYHEGKFCLANNILVMKVPDSWSKRSKIFLGTLISKLGYGGYNNYPRKETLKENSISLPIDKDGNIDFEFIDNFVRELERARLRELEAYLVATGLNNYELTAADKAALNNFRNLNWQEFNVKKLFGDSTRGKRLKSEDRIPGTLPFVTAGEAETGVSAFIGNNVTVFSKNTTTIDMFGSAKYRNYEYGADDHVAVVHTENLEQHAAIFVTSACHKAAHTGKFDFGQNFYAKDADELNIMLPVCADGKTPDFAAMEQIVAAVQKIVIADVAKYTARNLEATQQVIEAQDEPQIEQTITPLITDPKESEKYISLLPVYSLRAACGYFGDGEEVEELGWMRVEGIGRLNKDMFVVQAVGQSMEPRIHNGDYCVFEKYSGGSRQGKIVLAQHRGYFDEDNAGAYSIKEYSSEKSYNDDGSWQHESITLRPFNPAYEPIRIDAEDAESFAIIGEFVGVVTL